MMTTPIPRINEEIEIAAPKLTIVNSATNREDDAEMTGGCTLNDDAYHEQTNRHLEQPEGPTILDEVQEGSQMQS